MAIQITLDIFSGRQNPTWELSDPQIVSLKKLLFSLKQRTYIKSPKIFVRLGYQGFIISSTYEPDLPEKITVFANHIDFGNDKESYEDRNHEIEIFLLKTAGNKLEPESKKSILKTIKAQTNNFTFFLNKKNWRLKFFTEPPYNPSSWNNNPYKLKHNNCYNYGCDIVTNTFAQPGLGGGRKYGVVSCNEVGSGSIRDGLIPIRNASSTPSEGHYVALVVGFVREIQGWDFHWYRRDNNNLWSHKRGESPVINYDMRGNTISDPITADRGDYSEFCGYYHVITSRVKIL